MRTSLPRALVIAILATSAVLGASGLGPPRARAFHTGSLFGASAGAGGTGGYFYTGSPRERGWTCASCHVDAPGELRVGIRSDGTLFTDRSYVPGQAYAITVTIENERLGLSASRSNFNGMALTVLDATGSPAGELSGYDASRFYARGTAILASNSTVVGETEWTFTWTAPPAGAGAVTFHLGVVDGDGAGSGPTETLTDPFGDDLAVGRLVIAEGS